MKEVYTIMTATLGVPPQANKKFVFDYYDKDGKPGRWEGTPVEFYKVCFGDSSTLTISRKTFYRTSPLESITPRNHSPLSMTQGMNTGSYTPLID